MSHLLRSARLLGRPLSRIRYSSNLSFAQAVNTASAPPRWPLRRKLRWAAGTLGSMGLITLAYTGYTLLILAHNLDHENYLVTSLLHVHRVQSFHYSNLSSPDPRVQLDYFRRLFGFPSSNTEEVPPEEREVIDILFESLAGLPGTRHLELVKSASEQIQDLTRQKDELMYEGMLNLAEEVLGILDRTMAELIAMLEVHQGGSVVAMTNKFKELLNDAGRRKGGGGGYGQIG